MLPEQSFGESPSWVFRFDFFVFEASILLSEGWSRLSFWITTFPSSPHLPQGWSRLSFWITPLPSPPFLLFSNCEQKLGFGISIVLQNRKSFKLVCILKGSSSLWHVIFKKENWFLFSINFKMCHLATVEKKIFSAVTKTWDMLREKNLVMWCDINLVQLQSWKSNRRHLKTKNKQKEHI